MTATPAEHAEAAHASARVALNHLAQAAALALQAAEHAAHAYEPQHVTDAPVGSLSGAVTIQSVVAERIDALAAQPGADVAAVLLTAERAARDLAGVLDVVGTRALIAGATA